MSSSFLEKIQNTGTTNVSSGNGYVPDVFDNISTYGFSGYDPNTTLSTNGYQTLRNQSRLDNRAPSFDFANSELNASLKADNLALQNANLKANADYVKSQRDWATGANTIKWDDVHSVGDFGSWLTGNRGGGSNYLTMGIQGVGVAADIYKAYNQNKYQNKMANIAKQAQELQAKQYALYEKQVGRQNAKSDAAQAAYDKAQQMTV